MSAATIKARAFGSQGSITRSLDSWSTSEGWSRKAAPETLEEMSAPGLDYARWRRTGARHVPFRATSLESVADYSAAVAAAREYQSLQGRVCALTLDRDPGNTIDIMVLTCDPSCSTGKISDAAKASNTGIVECLWEVVCLAPSNDTSAA